MIWSSILRPRILIFFPVSVKVFGHFNQPFDANMIMSYIMDIATITVLPVFSLAILTKNFSKLGEKDFKNKYESLYGNLDVKKASAKSFLFIQCLVRIFLALITNFFQKSSIGSVIPYIVISVGYTALIYHQNPMNCR
mgnify:CR=1 FL=1